MIIKVTKKDIPDLLRFLCKDVSISKASGRRYRVKAKYALDDKHFIVRGKYFYATNDEYAFSNSNISKNQGASKYRSWVEALTAIVFNPHTDKPRKKLQEMYYGNYDSGRIRKEA